MRARVLRSVVLSAVLAASCSSDTDLGGPARVDPELDERSIAVRGEAEVGARIGAVISPDLEGNVTDWGWHRCIDVPTCVTIEHADSGSYELTEADAWHVLRVIAVADGPDGSGAVEDRIGPVTNPHPKRFTVSRDVQVGMGFRVIVAPGVADITVDAPCPVAVVAGVKTPSAGGDAEVGGLIEVEEARHHELEVEGDGGELVVGTAGGCSQATITVSAER